MLYLNLIGQIIFLDRELDTPAEKQTVMIKKKNHLHMQSYGQTLSVQVTPSSFSTTNMTKMMAIFLGQVKEFPSLWQLPEDVLRVSKLDEYK